MSVEMVGKVQKSKKFLRERVSLNRKTVHELVDDDRDQHTRLLDVAIGLRQNERLFREVINGLPAAIYITDTEGRLTHFNEAAVELSGRVPELGTDHWCVTWKLYYPDGTPMPHDECPMAVALKEGRAVRGAEAIGERPDGTRFWFTPYPTPLFDDQGNVIGGINMLVDITERKIAEARSQSDADALTKLNELSSRLWSMRNLRDGLDEMLSATIEMLGADFGNIQLLNEIRGVLTIEAQCGFKQDFLDFFREVRANDDSACARALRSGERIIIEDVEMDAPFASMLHVIHEAGYRAVQSTPLIGRNGTPLGTISTHFRAVHRPTDQELRRLDLYARQASDFIERCRVDDALRQSEERFRMLADNMGQLAWICDQLGNVTWYNHRWLDYTGLTFEDMKGWDWSKVQHPDHLERVVVRLRHSSETGEPWEDTFPLRG
jgi:PAS domain S-box-containing protein